MLFGVETYPNTSLEPVPAAPRNTGALRCSFADPELWGLRGNHRLVVEADPSKADMLDAVANAARIPDDDGILLIYFVGHALYGGGTLYLAGSDANLSQTSTLLTIPELTEAAASSAAARKLLILDCCYSGAAAGSLKAETQAANEAAGWLLIAATDVVPAQNARLDEEFTPFTAALLASFEGSPGVGRSLSPRTVLAHAATLLEGSREPTTRPGRTTRGCGTAGTDHRPSPETSWPTGHPPVRSADTEGCPGCWPGRSGMPGSSGGSANSNSGPSESSRVAC
ncbi:caspase family protein [Micromonospora craniellae]|uniref:caspase family protein n=1 Tax=Micromonospora craniellae TaxID=2294034 RepID=UPI0013145865|nr:caspase family protein [Micromonospora craniellae]